MTNDENYEAPTFENMWEVIQSYVGQFYPGILVNGLLTMEFATASEMGPSRTLRTVTNPDLAVWTAKGLLHDVLDQMQADEILSHFLVNDDEGDDDDE